MRNKLSLCYNIIGKRKWTDLSFGHLSAKGTDGKFWTHNKTKLFSEVTPENLVQVDINGKVISQDPDIQIAGFGVNGAVHRRRESIKCVIHLHNKHTIAVSIQPDGLGKNCQIGLMLGRVPNLEPTLDFSSNDGNSAFNDTVLSANCCLLRGHGAVTWGESVEQAFAYMHFLVTACEIQLMAGTSAKDLTNTQPESLLELLKSEEFCKLVFEASAREAGCI